MAYYTLQEESAGLVLKPDSRERRTLAVVAGIVGVLLLVAAAYSLLKVEPDLTGFAVWLAVGLALNTAAATSLSVRTEFAVDAAADEFVRRHYRFGREVQRSAIGFDSVKAVHAARENHASSGDVPEHSFGWLKIIAADGSTWAKVKMSSGSQADKARRKILALTGIPGENGAA